MRPLAMIFQVGGNGAVAHRFHQLHGALFGTVLANEVYKSDAYRFYDLVRVNPKAKRRFKTSGSRARVLDDHTDVVNAFYLEVWALQRTSSLARSATTRRRHCGLWHAIVS